MNTATIRRWRGRDTLALYLREAGFQFWNVARMPGFVLPTLLFPSMFYVFFGLVFSAGKGGDAATYLLATYGTFGVMAPALFGFGVGVASEREHGILALKRVSPMPSLAYFLSKAVMAMAFAAIIALVLFSLGALFGQVRLAYGQWFALLATLVLGTLPFCALGLAVGMYAGAQSATAIINLIYLPVAFLSGLWVPLRLFPHWLQTLAPALPAYHLSQIALGIVHEGDGSRLLTHLVYLVLFTAVCLRLSQRGWRRIQDR